MADFQPNTVLWKLVIEMDIVGINCQNVFHFRNKTLIPEDALPSYTAGLIDDWNIRMLEGWRGIQVQGVAYIRAVNTVIIPHAGPFVEHTYPPGTNGQIESDPLPSYCAMVISKQTGFSGRRNRGRFYIPGVGQAMIIVNNLLENYENALILIANLLLLNWGPLGSDTRNQIVLYSHKDGDVGGLPTLAGVKPITKFSAHRQIFTQRHRLQGVGI